MLEKPWKDYLKVDSVNNWMDVELVLNHFILENNYYNRISKIYDSRINNYGIVLEANSIIQDFFLYFKTKDLKDVDFETFLLSELKYFENDFCRYIDELIHKENHTWLQKRIFDRIVNSCDPKLVMTFNYTYPPVDESKFSICFVHGVYSNGEVIIGIDPTNNRESKNGNLNYSSIGNKVIFTKTYRKMYLDSVYEEQVVALKKNIQIVSFYGHSLGEQDYSYFQSIFDFYSLYDSDIILEFLYSEHDSKSEEKELNLTLGRVYKLINEYGETLTNKDHGKNLLHKLLLERRLIIKKI